MNQQETTRRFPPFIRPFGNNFYFRFIIHEPQLKIAECYGRTQNEYTAGRPGEQFENLNRAVSHGAKRFPFAARFKSIEECAEECDRWRRALLDRYRVPIDIWADATRVIPETWDSIEFKDFINQNQSTLETWAREHTDSTKMFNVLIFKGTEKQKAWVRQIDEQKAILKSISALNDIETIRQKVKSAEHYSGLLAVPCRKLATGKNKDIAQKANAVLAGSGVLISACNALLRQFDETTARLKFLEGNAPDPNDK